MNRITFYIKKGFAILGFATLIVCFSACTKNLLNPDNQTSISDATAFDTPERILAQVNGLYSAIKASQFYGGRYIIYNELRADEFIMNKPNVVTGQLTWSHNVNSSTSEVQNLWSAAYAAINRVNIFLKGLEENKSKISPTLYENYVGEAKVMRALSYLALVQTYSRPYIEDKGASMGVPLRLQAESSSMNNDLARSSVADVYTQILADLDDAEAGLPLTYSTPTLRVTRAHRNTAIALKTRVYLVMGEYSKVLEEAMKIVPASAPFKAPTGVPLQLESSPVDVFSGDYTGTEAILFLPMNAQDAPGGQNSLSYYFTFTPGNAEYYLNTQGIMADPVFATTSSDLRKNWIVTQQSLPWLYKYKMPSPYIDFIPVARYAEVLLNTAEAAARTGQDEWATALLKAVRRRSDLSYSFADENINTPDALLSSILHERKIELFGEGFRVPDLLRLMEPLPGKASSAGTIPAVEVNDPRYIWPIPANELANNKLAKPNP